jgi:hypothetical protein
VWRNDTIFVSRELATEPINASPST